MERFKNLPNFASAMTVIENCPMKGRNTFGIDVSADKFIEFGNEDELRSVLAQAGTPLLTVGGGSNLLFLDDFHGTVLHSAISGIEVLEETDEYVMVSAGSGVVWDDFVGYCVGHGWWGAENLTAIPGEVGASAVQNIGAYGCEVGDIIHEVRTVSVKDGSVRVFSNEECRYGYRYSIFKAELKGQYIVTYVTYRLSRKANPNLGYGALRQSVGESGETTLENIRNAVRRIRDSKLPDPKVLGNAGSFFMNPVISQSDFESIRRAYPEVPSYPAGEGLVKVPAGWLIEKCGWKGRALGPAAVHDRQALVLVNRGGAKGSDIKALADAVISDVEARFGIRLKAEVNFILS